MSRGAKPSQFEPLPGWRLAYALDFTPEDLAANRQGRLSRRQARVLRRYAALSVARAVALCVPVFIILSLLFNSPGVDGILWALLLGGVPYVANAFMLWPLVRDINSRAVESITGRVTLERERRVPLLRFPPIYYLVVDDMRFRTNRRVYRALNEETYTIHYLPGVRWAVSVTRN